MTVSLPLNQANLTRLPAKIARPTYDRSRLRAGIIHVGVGGFHRSHEAYYTDEWLATSGDTDWGICGVGLREADRKIADILRDQDYLYTLIVKHPDGEVSYRVIGALVDFMLGCDDPEAVVGKMAHVDTQIVSLTITEGGYNFNPSTGEFDFSHPDVCHDLAHLDRPKTIFGFLTAALQRRRRAGLPAFTVQSCDNIEHNGDTTCKMLLAFTRKLDPELAAWIEREVRFPNAMVDRITPVTTPADIKHLEREFGLDDQWPVVCEPFIQWVIEDHFVSQRPAWENVGAQFVPDVAPYETMKLRLLNAGHSVLGLLGSLHESQTIDECVADPLFATYLRRFMDLEVTPVLDTVDGIDLEDYKDDLIERFGNPAIKDDLARICLESSAKLPKFLIPTIRENLNRGGRIDYATLVIVAWCYYSDRGCSADGTPLSIVDQMKNELHEAAVATKFDPLSFLTLKPIFGDLVFDHTFAAHYKRAVKAFYDCPDIVRHMQAIVSGG